ncbi:MAG: hypothetical protein KGI54_13530 [Pseudomonadota bacterium]|nr:hypothetical protein [Pseudomonadota bacterium]
MMEAIIKKAPAKKVAVKKVAVATAARLKKVVAKEAAAFVDNPLRLYTAYDEPQIAVAYPDPNDPGYVVKFMLNLEFAHMPTQFGCAQVGMPAYKQLLGWTLVREDMWRTDTNQAPRARRHVDAANLTDAIRVLAEHVIGHFRSRVVVPGFSQMAIVGINGREHKDSVEALGLEPLTEIMTHLEKYDGKDIKFDIKMIEFQNQVHTERSGGPKSRVWLYSATCLAR